MAIRITVTTHTPEGVIGSTIFIENLDVENLIAKYWYKVNGG